ncbi:spore germination protein KC [Paenibacillus catalpae]|uniref:Spore germination protein KC n=1 Tax=Paenibacillus catalpae TaxID=1045775 RepID=A0A1I2BU06_9BACL|nr:Ger(x)C family spore germination protein [Paenibacillus catalpae]SFE59579.1 spore germination protein KC [Paenibacillus catalpae]
MIQRVFFIILTMALSSLTITGCWDRKELNEVGIAVAIGVDTAPKDHLKVTAQVVIPSEVASSQSAGKGGTSVTVYEAVAPTLLQAIQKMTEISPRRVYLGHIRMLIFGESFARKGISEIVETMVREPTTRSDFYVAVAKGKRASDILKVTTPMERIPANKMFASLDASSESWAPTTKVTIDTLMDNLLNSGSTVMTGIQMVGDFQDGVGDNEKNIEQTQPITRLRFSGLGVFKKDRLIGWLSEEESKGYNYFKNHIRETAGYLNMPGGERIGLHLIRSKTVIKGLVVKGSPKIRVNVTASLRLTEVKGTTMKISSPQDLRDLEQRSSERIIELMELAVDSARRRFRIDIFGFGQLIHESDPNAWRRLEKNWDDTFMTLEIDYNVNTRIGKMGALMDTFQKSMKE